MDFYPITLGIGRPEPHVQGGPNTKKKGAGATGSSSAYNPNAKKLPNDLRQKIIERDNNTCQCCGFEAKKYQEILLKNHIEGDFDEDNLITTCVFCHQCFHIDKTSAMRSGTLIWLPEIDQPTLHHIARAIYVARISQGPVADAARKALDILMGRREQAKARIQTDDPYILSMVLSDYLGAGHYAQRGKKLDGIRLFPLDRRIIKEADLEFNQFPQILAYWRSKDGPFGGKTPPQWISLYQSIMQKAA